MIIKRLTMHNFGVYAGTNTFDFLQEKPIVLIGGMNGRGKTTFLEAILISLYGMNSIAYKESKFHSYNQYLRSFVNKGDWSQSCYVELTFVLNETSHDIYTIKRSWDALSKITKESIAVYQNGTESEFLTKNWAMFIENILPSALSGFFFFDGEKIAELALDDSNQQMKESIRAMLGLTVLDVLKSDLERIIRRNGKKTSDNTESSLEQMRQERDAISTGLQKTESDIAVLQAKISESNVKIEELHGKYEISGGEVVAQRQKLIQERAMIQNSIEQNREMLSNLASTELPLFLVEDLIEQIKNEAEKEHDDFVMKQAMEKMNRYLEDFESENHVSADESRRFIEYVKKVNKTKYVKPLYSLNDQTLFQLRELSTKALEQRVNEVEEKIHQKNELKKQMDEVESYLSIDVNENELADIYEKIKEEEKNLVQLQVELSKLEQERSSLNARMTTKTAEYNRNVEAYLQNAEMMDDAERTIKYSHMAMKIVNDYMVELQRRKTGKLGKTITECYKKLANKKNLIHEIVMDEETLDIAYLDENGNPVSKNSLSAGEKQLMVIAVLWALAICSRKKLPVIIDTPLSRLDSQHRAAIVTTYFPNASDQTIILSTDTEIDHKYYEMMKEFVGDEFTLEYNEEAKSTSIKKGYFKRV